MTTVEDKKHLYFIAIILPAELREKITAIKQDFANHFESRHALKVVSHITLKSPFRLAESSESILLNWFETLEITVSPFLQELNDFGIFPKNRSPVIFIKPDTNKFLFELHEQVMFQFQQQFAEFDPVNAEVNYKPHITVAYRDLKHEQFVKAWSEYQFKKFHAVFGVNNFWLLKHIKHKWECIAEFKLQ